MQKTTKDNVTIDSLLRRQTSMKKYLLLLTASLSLTVAHGQTAVYHPFPDSNASWNERCFGLNPSHTCMNEDFKTLFINGDTILGSFTYHKIYRVGYTVYSCWNPPTQPVYQNYTAYYDGAIRQDSLQKKVFIWAGKDTLLYDFNLNVGDTVPPSVVTGSFLLVVNTIDSVLVGSKYHKRFNCQGSQPVPEDTLVEGIGSVLYGLYNMKGIYPDGGCKFICFAHNTATYPANSNCSTLTTNITETTIPTINLSPNPFSTQTTLQTAERLQNASLTVYNSVGLTVKRVDNLTGQTIIFHRDNLPSGLYFVRLTQDGNTISADKFVIADE